MYRIRTSLLSVLVFNLLFVWLRGADAQDAAPLKQIPDPLKAWAAWATWDDLHRDCPTPFSDPKKHQCFWPSRLLLQIEPTGARFDLAVTVFHETWVPLPGDDGLWPFEVKAGDAPLPVIEREGVPSVRLLPGTVRLTGTFQWSVIPQKIRIPPPIGILALTLGGEQVATPAWDADGTLWLKRDATTEQADKDFLAVKIYRVLEDGIPLWLRTEIELIVSGKSREEELGTILPAGWKIAVVESGLPVAVDDAGNIKVQVRAGKWTVRADAFRFDNPTDLQYAANARRLVTEELIALRARPEFRIIEIVGPPSIDVTQTTFPDKWRNLPVYRWEPATPFRIEERLRGMGAQKPAGLSIIRELWLDDNGRGLTFRDNLSGQMQQIWRLDAATGQELGAVRAGGQGQLITRNPQTNAPGIEIRTRTIDLEATGRIEHRNALSATGWQSDAEGLRATLNLPPGWRLFALFGADWVQGDWLTAWTLLDLFLLLIFSVAVTRLHGPIAGVLAFVAFGIAYHEPGAPRLIWLILLVPLALLRVVPPGAARTALIVGKWIALGFFVAIAVPFLGRQVQQAIYPQLEVVRDRGFLDGLFLARAAPPARANNEGIAVDTQAPPPPAAPAAPVEGRPAANYRFAPSAIVRKEAQKENLSYDPAARIQTGPGVPQWKWRATAFGWNGPVRAAQEVRPFLISAGVERLLTIVRIALVVALAALLLNARGLRGTFARRRGAAAVIALLALCHFLDTSAHAQVPDKTTLDTLRQRLLEPSDAYPHAADIPLLSVTLQDRQIVIEAEVHAAVRTSVPVPGRLPAWSPLSVLVDGKPEAALRRDGGYLWVLVPEGIHRIRVEGALTNLAEWELTFDLKPRRVQIDAPGWTVTGVRPDGTPEAQIFFVIKERAAPGEASYERRDLQTVVGVDRYLELGLQWQVRSTAQRLSPVGKAIALRVPLLPGENVLTSNALVKDGFIEVRLGAQEESFTWESGLAVAEQLNLVTRPDDTWVERWHLIASPIWNIAFTGLAPTFDPANPQLVPVWQPWPGETVQLAVSRPDAVAGAVVTVNSATHEVTLGKRQRTSKLLLSILCSLGSDFPIALPADAEVTVLLHNGKSIPVRKADNSVVVPLQPGAQTVTLEWKLNTVLGFRAAAEPVRLPVESANIQTTMRVPENRWILWANGPLRGPAVRFWIILVCSLLAAWVLGRVATSPLRTAEWMLLTIGLTQVPLAAAILVIAWLFLLQRRGHDSFARLTPGRHNLIQVVLIGLTATALGILITAVGEGLLGNPEMFISGNASDRTTLNWYQARAADLLPTPFCISVSIWWYRFFMLLWALWLALAVIRWLRWGWANFSKGGLFRSSPPRVAIPPPLPVQK